MTTVTPTRPPDPPTLLNAYIVLVGGIKGGVCKTWTSIFLAFVFAATGRKVLVIDADAGAGTTRNWLWHAKRNGITLPFDVEIHPSEDLPEMIEFKGWRQQYHVIIIDTGGHSDRVLRAAFRVADHMVLPMSPSPAELATLPGTAEATVGAVRDRDIPVTIVMVRVKSRRMALDAAEALTDSGFTVLDSMVGDRVSYQKAFGVFPAPDDFAEYDAVRAELEESHDIPTAPTPDAPATDTDQ